MKQLARLTLSLVGIVLLLASCEKAPYVAMSGPHNYNFNCKGGTETFTVSSNRDWSISSSASWISVSPSSGVASDKEITVTITCSPNTTYEGRTATIKVKAEALTETITVVQDPWVEE